MTQKRIRFFVDGFNVYHSLANHRKLLWLNYQVLAQLFIRPNQILENVLYFTAIAHFLPDSARRHQIYLRALEAEGVKIIKGRFKEKDKWCPLCRKHHKGHEEKETDVNLAIHLVKGALKREFDTAIVVSNDTDLVPAIQLAQAEAPAIKIGVLFPLNRHSSQLKQIASFALRTKLSQFRKAQFPDPYVLPDGSSLAKPCTWL